MRPEIRKPRHHNFSQSFNNFVGAISLLLLLGGFTGCASRIAAGRIIAAPNRTQSNSAKTVQQRTWNQFQKLVLAKDNTNPVVRATIPVGPPDAKLKAIVFPPQDYHLQVVSKYGETSSNAFMSINIGPSTNTFTRLKKPATVVVLHGYSLQKESMVPWALVLAQAGFRVVLVDLRGHGESTGWQISFGKYETADLTRVLDYLIEKELCDEQIGVLGFSYGATLALHWAARDSRVRTVAAIAPYNQPAEAMERLAVLLKTSLAQETMREAAEIASARLSLNWADWSGENAVRQIKTPVLLVGGGQDTICPPEDIEILRTLAPDGSKVIQISKSNHFALGYWFHELAKPVTSWFQQFLELPPESNPGEGLLISGKHEGGNSPSGSDEQSRR